MPCASICFRICWAGEGISTCVSGARRIICLLPDEPADCYTYSLPRSSSIDFAALTSLDVVLENGLAPLVKAARLGRLGQLPHLHTLHLRVVLPQPHLRLISINLAGLIDPNAPIQAKSLSELYVWQQIDWFSLGTDAAMLKQVELVFWVKCIRDRMSTTMFTKNDFHGTWSAAVTTFAKGVGDRRGRLQMCGSLERTKARQKVLEKMEMIGFLLAMVLVVLLGQGMLVSDGRLTVSLIVSLLCVMVLHFYLCAK